MADVSDGERKTAFGCYYCDKTCYIFTEAINHSVEYHRTEPLKLKIVQLDSNKSKSYTKNFLIIPCELEKENKLVIPNNETLTMKISRKPISPIPLNPQKRRKLHSSLKKLDYLSDEQSEDGNEDDLESSFANISLHDASWNSETPSPAIWTIDLSCTVCKIEVSSLQQVLVLSVCLEAKKHHKSHHKGHHHGNQGHRHGSNHESANQESSDESFEIVFPQIIEKKAGVILNTVDVENYVGRRKRTLGGSDAPLEISISGRGEQFELELWENKDLLAPGFKVYRQDRLQGGNQKVVSGEDEAGSCLFKGKVVSHAGTPASLTLCNGMNGLIRTKKDDYIIEPIKDATMHGASGFVGQPHKLYKRSVLDSHNQRRYEAQSSGKQSVVVEKSVDHPEDELEIREQSKLLDDMDLTKLLMDEEIHGSQERTYHSVEKRDTGEEEEPAVRVERAARSGRTQRDGRNTRDGRGMRNVRGRTRSGPGSFGYKFLQEMNVVKTVEMLVVVDKNMYHKHGDANVTTYTLTLFNMLSQLFKDGSLGNKINVVLVGLILLEGDERGLNIDYNADDTLNSFCSWQSVLVGANGRQHDHAILLTGLDVCSYKNSPCDTLGFAPMEGMCNRVRSCTVNEDTGLSTAFTIAHEVGHNFGMFHDGEGNYCTESAGKIMSPTLMGKDGQFHWSVCSKAYLMRFLNTPQSDCLDDRPKQVAELKFPDKLPGELYNADIQCKWQFGNKARLCTYDFGKDICKALWCFRGNKRCETKFLPAAEGTSCGNGMWCRQGKCVDYGHNGPKPIDGAWSTWSEWSECSRSCGGGVITRERECSRPLPQYGGKSCDGVDKMYKLCNVQDCPADGEDFHTAQCATYNKQPFQGWYLQWKPSKRLNDVTDPCKLLCIADTPSYVFTIKHTATDGMKCGAADDNFICVQGECKNVGCDWMVGSSLSNDMCGVCDGDNSTCRLIEGEYLEQPKLNTYFPVTILPKTARSIKIQEKSLSSNYLAVRNIFGNYFLNGHQRVAWPGAYKLGGAKFTYSRPYNEPETLEAEGPLEEELVLEILVQDHNPGIRYEYTVPITVGDQSGTTQRPDNYTWSLSMSSCSEPCAGGKKTSSALCLKNFDQEVEPVHCEGQDKLETGVFPCNMHACKPRWVTEDWRACTRKCGGGKQRRRVRCRQKVSRTKDRKLRRKSCRGQPRPIQVQPCNDQECPPGWHTARWSKCSALCGRGDQKRAVTCRSKKGRKALPESMCHIAKPEVRRSCNTGPCTKGSGELETLSSMCKVEPCGPRWTVTEWSDCSRDCRGGIQKRKVRCVDDTGLQIKNRMCKHLEKPERKRACNVQDCPAAWHSGKWSECSVSCGKGEQSRRVSCRTKGIDGNKIVSDSLCTTTKPESTSSCDKACDSNEQYDWLLSPWGPCSVTCGSGQSARYLRCSRLDAHGRTQTILPDRHCNNMPRPTVAMVQSCHIMDCDGSIRAPATTAAATTTKSPVDWEVTGWSECSSSCGTGVQSRIVSCVNSRGQSSSGCDDSTRPDYSRPCNNGECLPTPLGQVSCLDQFSWCYLVPRHKVCNNPLYSVKCCKSCSNR